MSIIQKTNIFFREVYVELRKTNWLKRSDIVRYTLLVLGVTILVAAVLGGLDFVFSTLVQKYIVK